MNVQSVFKINVTVYWPCKTYTHSLNISLKAGANMAKLKRAIIQGCIRDSKTCKHFPWLRLEDMRTIDEQYVIDDENMSNHLTHGNIDKLKVNIKCVICECR